MQLAKVFISGGSQAVRLPKDCRFEDNEVFVNRLGSVVVLLPKSDPWAGVQEGLRMFTKDCLEEEIVDPPAQERAMYNAISLFKDSVNQPGTRRSQA